MTNDRTDDTSPPEPTNPPKIWHYTNADGLLGILNEGQLWATAPQSLNDSGELAYWLAIIREAWAEKRPTIATSCSASTLNFVDALISGAKQQELLDSLYIASASGSPDLISQWQVYSGTDGFSLGLEANANTLWLPLPDGEEEIPAQGTLTSFLPDPYWREVQYSPDAQRTNARNLIDDFIPRLESSKDEADQKMTRLSLESFARIMAVTTKFPGFHGESELRLTSPAFGQRISFRSLRGRLVPYIKLNCCEVTSENTVRKRNLPLTEVICGPAASTSTIGTVQRLLDSLGYQGVGVRRSELPLR